MNKMNAMNVMAAMNAMVNELNEPDGRRGAWYRKPTCGSKPHPSVKNSCGVVPVSVQGCGVTGLTSEMR